MDRAFVFICILVPIYVDIPFHWNIFILEAEEVTVQAWGSSFDTQQSCKKRHVFNLSVGGWSSEMARSGTETFISAYKMERSDLHICTHRQAHPSHAEATVGYTGQVGKRHCSLYFSFLLFNGTQLEKDKRVIYLHRVTRFTPLWFWNTGKIGCGRHMLPGT